MLSQTQDILQNFLTVGAIITLVSGVIFSLVLAILISFFKVSAQFTTVEILRGQTDKVSVKDSFRSFDTDIFSKIFATLFLKQFLLFLWSLIINVGGSLTIGSSFAIVFYYLSQGIVLPTLSNLLFIGLFLSLLGWLIVLPQQYAYSQVEYILYDQLASGQYHSAFAIIKESRQMMKGYKIKRFTLDLTFVGWWILSGLTLGIVGIHVIPYQEIANVIFYENLRSENLA